MKPITKAWLDRALDDLDAIEQLLEIEHLTNIVAFHAQQAVEKSLKAAIEELEISFVKIHSLVRLYALVQPYYDLTQDMDTLEQLDAVYTESRYPSEMGLLPYSKPTIAESKKFYRFARQFYEQVTVNLEPEQEE
jgi:HEPN domain-containing protein